MQTTSFIKTIKWLYGLEIHETLEFFRGGFAEYLKSGRAGVAARIEDAYNRGISVNNQARQIEANTDATRLLDAFALTDLYDAERWQGVVSTFLQVLAAEDESAQAETVKQTLDELNSLAERIQILLSCVGPLQQLCVPSSVLRLSDFDDVLTLEIRSLGPDAPESSRLEAVLSATGELYAALCQINGLESPQPLRVLHMSAESGCRFDLTGEAGVVLEFKQLLVELWQRIRNQDRPHVKDVNRTVIAGLAPFQTIAKRVKQRKLSAAAADQLRQRLSNLAMKMFDHGVKIREIPDTDTVDNRRLLEQIQQSQQKRAPRSQPAAEPKAEAAAPAAETKKPAAAKAPSTKASTAKASTAKASTAKTGNTAKPSGTPKAKASDTKPSATPAASKKKGSKRRAA